MDPDWQNVTTDIEFPVNQGEVIVVKCKRNHINLGARSFTCVMGTSFNEKDDKPLCKKIGRSVSFFSVKSVSRNKCLPGKAVIVYHSNCN